MHLALQRLIRVLAECEADRLCAQREAGSTCEVEPEEVFPMKKSPRRHSGEERSHEQEE